MIANPDQDKLPTKRLDDLHAFLVRFSDAARRLEDPATIASMACRFVVEELQAERAYWAEIDWESREFVVGAAYHAPTSPTVTGRFRLDDWEPFTSYHVQGRPVVVDDVSTDSRIPPRVRDGYAALGIAADLAVPVRTSGQLRCTLAINQGRARAWRDDEVGLARAIADRCWAEIERARAEQAVRDSERALAADLASAELLRSLSERLVTEESLQSIYEEVLSATVDIMRADAGTVQVYDPVTRSLELIASRNFSHTITDYFHRVDASSRTACGIALQTGGYAFADFPEEIEDFGCQLLVGEGIQSAVAYPLMSRSGTPLGMLNAHWRRANHRSDDREVRFLGLLARQAADLIEQRQSQSLLRESEERQAFLLKLSDIIRPLADAADIQGETTRVLREKLSAGWCYYVEWDLDRKIGLVRRDSARERLPSLAGEHDVRDAPEFLTLLAAGEVLTARDYASYEQLPARIRQNFTTLGFRSMMAAPLVKNGHLIASLLVGDTDIREWSPFEASLLVEVAERTWAALERARAEAALRQSEVRLAQLADAAPVLIWETSEEGATFVNSHYLAYFGVAFDDIAGFGWTRFVHPDDLEGYTAAYNRAVAERRPYDYECRLLRTDGQYRWHRTTGRPATPGRFVDSSTDIHESRLAQQALKDAESRMQTLVEGVPQLVWRAVHGGRWTWASPQWTSYTGQAEPDSHDRGWLEPVHPDDRDHVLAAWGEAAEHGEFHADYRIRHEEEDRYRWFQTRATPVRDDRGAITEWLGTSTDVDDLRGLQERQHVLVAELQHRTRNLIGVVRSTADRTGETSADLVEFRDRFRDRLDALARVQGLLSKLNDADRIAFDELIHTEIAAMQGPGERVTLDGPSGIRLRSSMVQTLAMALHELATNAVKYGALGQPDGRLSVSWRMVEPDRHGRPRLRIDWQESGVTMPSQGTAPQGGGHGRELIERALPYQLSAETSFELGSNGVRCSITMPVSASAARSTSTAEQSS